MRLDKTDFKIMKILQQNSKITNLELSKRIGLSPAPTLERVKKIENGGAIKSYHAVLDPELMGIKVQTFVLVVIDWQKENALDRFIEHMKEFDAIVECHIITGDADALLKIQCKDIASYEKLLFGEISSLPEVERIKTLMTLSNVKKSNILPIEYEIQGKIVV